MNKKIIVLSLILSALLITSVSVFAYFNLATNSNDLKIEKDLNSDTIDIDSFDSLISYAKNETYNNSSESSSISDNSASRKALKLKNDIVLYNDLYITADVNLDLAGHALYLNGYKLTYNNKFYGTFQIYSSVQGAYIIPEQVIVSTSNDTITYTAKTDATLGYIEIYTPNAVVTTNKNISCKVLNNYTDSAKSEEVKTLSDYIKVVASSNLYLCYDAYKLISEKLLNYTDERLENIDLTTLSTNKNITTTDNVYSFSSTLYMPTRSVNSISYCAYSTTEHACAYVTDSMDLPFTYYNYSNVSIEYESSNSKVVSSLGIVTLPSSEENVTLTIKIKLNDEVIATSDLVLHVVNTSNADDSNKLAKTFAYESIKKYYNNDSNLYRFDHDLILPKKIGNASITYTPYAKSTDSDAETIFDDDTNTYKAISSSSAIKDVDGDNAKNYVLLSPNSSLKALKINVATDSSELTTYVKAACIDTVISNESTLAKNLLNEWYGGKITINKTDDNYSNQELYCLCDIDTTAYPNITSLYYKLTNDSNRLYSLTDTTNSEKGLLQVANGKTPEKYIQDVLLTCVFVINGKDISIDLSIEVKLGSDETISSFMPYYYYYNDYVKNNANNYFDSNVEIPLAYSATGPIVLFDFVTLSVNYEEPGEETGTTYTSDSINQSSAIRVKLYYNKNSYLLDEPSKGSSYKDIFDKYLTDNNLSLDTILSYGDAKWIIVYNLANVDNTNTNMGLLYNYKMKTSDNWTTYCYSTTTKQYLTTFTLAGALHYGTEIKDETFYKWIYDSFNINVTSNTKYSTGDYTKAVNYASGTSEEMGKYILVDWLNQNVSLDVTTDTALSSVTDFTGIKYLTGCHSINLTGKLTNKTTAIQICREIAELKNLETLILKNCTGITDGFDTTSYTASDNDSISRFSALKNLSILNVEGCNIYTFDFLDELTWLGEVHIENQQTDSDTTLSIFYGSNGLTNYWVFGDLTLSGVSVYNTYQGSGEVLFEESKTINDYTRLKNGILYQSQLKSGVNISTLYSDFSTTASDYLLAKSYNSYSVSNATLTWSFVEYEKTTDTSIDLTKTYYTRSGSTYSQVADPNVNDIATYYEKYSDQTAKSFQVTYSFTLNSKSISFSIKYNVERY